MKRREAKILGVKFYCTGKPCKHGHVSDRYTTTGMCVECVKLQSVKWRSDNAEKHKAAMRKWWENNKELHNLRVKRWQANNKGKISTAAKKWVANNPDKVAAKTKRWRDKNPDKVLAAAIQNNLAREKRVPVWQSLEDRQNIRKIYALARELTSAYGFKWEVDHIIPLRGATVSGLHVPENLQIIPKDVNRAKRNQFLS